MVTVKREMGLKILTDGDRITIYRWWTPNDVNKIVLVLLALFFIPYMLIGLSAPLFTPDAEFGVLRRVFGEYREPVLV